MNILTLQCKDQPGIVAKVSGALHECGCNVEEAAQFNDQSSGQFFMRFVFSDIQDGAHKCFIGHFQSVANDYDMNWSITPAHEPIKTLLLVSKADHCLHDILYRWRTDHLNIDITGVVSNHETCRSLVEGHGLPFHYFPVTANTKQPQESSIRQIIEHSESELIVLARYMQILSPAFSSAYMGRIINIHHSFLPGFKGARPYHQAYERGVKIIGATAHFVTEDLDEGPIIEQDIRHIDHSFTPQMLQQTGQDTEARVLSRAIKFYSERRIFLNGQRTVIL